MKQVFYILGVSLSFATIVLVFSEFVRRTGYQSGYNDGYKAAIDCLTIGRLPVYSETLSGNTELDCLTKFDEGEQSEAP